MALNPTIAKAKPTRMDPELKEAMDRVFNVSEDAKVFIEYLNSVKPTDSSATRPDLSKKASDLPAPKTDLADFLRRLGSAVRLDSGWLQIREARPDEQLSNYGGVPSNKSQAVARQHLGAVVLAAIRATDLDAQFGYLRPMQGIVTNPDGTVKMDLVIIFFPASEPMPQNLLYKYADTQEFKNDAARVLGTKGLKLLNEGGLNAVVFDAATGKIVQYEHVRIMTDPEAVSMYYTTLATHDIKQDKFTDAKNNLDTAFKCWSGNPKLHETRAERYYEMGNYAAAADSARQSLHFASNNANAYVILGKSQVELGEWGQAVASFSAAASINPENPLPHFELAKLYYELGKEALDKAMKGEKEGVDKDTTNAQKSIEYLEKAVKACQEAQLRMQMQGSTTDPQQANKQAADLAKVKAQAVQALALARQELGLKPLEKMPH